MIAANISLMLKARRRGIRTRFIFESTLVDTEVGPLIYVDFQSSALAEDRSVAAPDPLVMGYGLDRISAAMAARKKGVSAKTLVATL